MRVVIGEDSVLLRAGIAGILRDDGFEVVGEAGDLDTLLVTVRSTHPDVVVVDIRMPPTFTNEGLQAVDSIRAEHGPSIGILVLSQHLEPAFAVDLVTRAEGGMGYLLKERIAELGDFADALRRVARGGSIVDPAIVAELLRRDQRHRLVELTQREREVLSLMAEGRSNNAICERMKVSPKTVEAYISSLLSKLGLEPAPDDNRRVLAVLSYLRDDRRAAGGV